MRIICIECAGPIQVKTPWSSVLRPAFEAHAAGPTRPGPWGFNAKIDNSLRDARMSRLPSTPEEIGSDRQMPGFLANDNHRPIRPLRDHRHSAVLRELRVENPGKARKAAAVREDEFHLDRQAMWSRSPS